MDDEKQESSSGMNGAGQARFKNHLKTKLTHIHKNLYLNQDDPLYYEKILRYSDAQSPEAHFMLAQKYEKAGSSARALFHYQEAARSLTSPYYIKAKEGIKEIQNKSHRSELPMDKPSPIVPQGKSFSRLGKSLFICLVLLNLAVLIGIWNIDTIRAAVSSVKYGKVGMEVIYETMDVPYVIYLPYDESGDTIEKILYTRASSMGKENPHHTIQLFGIMTSNPALIGRIVPLSNEKLKEASVVSAQYNASLDQSVTIRFNNNEYRKPEDVSLILIHAASNLVRTALQTYINEKGIPPDNIENLIGDYPDNYLSFIPNEVQSGSNHVASQFDGKGGWVYHPYAEEMPAMFYPNTPDELSALRIPFQPIQIVISKNDYSLKVISGTSVLSSKSVGLGGQGRTPEGDFTIHERVLKPLGRHPDIYGEAGLGMGRYAIHGTYDESSIQANNSLGCIRLTNLDILAIFPLIPKGASVLIAPDFPPAYKQTPTIDPTRLFPAQKPQFNQTTDHIIFDWLG
ncbi:MAG TPA: L,D-transpeptidase [Bacilli bacterium]